MSQFDQKIQSLNFNNHNNENVTTAGVPIPELNVFEDTLNEIETETKLPSKEDQIPQIDCDSLTKLSKSERKVLLRHVFKHSNFFNDNQQLTGEDNERKNKKLFVESMEKLLKSFCYDYSNPMWTLVTNIYDTDTDTDDKTEKDTNSNENKNDNENETKDKDPDQDKDKDTGKTNNGDITNDETKQESKEDTVTTTGVNSDNNTAASGQTTTPSSPSSSSTTTTSLPGNSAVNQRLISELCMVEKMEPTLKYLRDIFPQIRQIKVKVDKDGDVKNSEGEEGEEMNETNSNSNSNSVSLVAIRSEKRIFEAQFIEYFGETEYVGEKKKKKENEKMMTNEDVKEIDKEGNEIEGEDKEEQRKREIISHILCIFGIFYQLCDSMVNCIKTRNENEDNENKLLSLMEKYLKLNLLDINCVDNNGQSIFHAITACDLPNVFANLSKFFNDCEMLKDRAGKVLCTYHTANILAPKN